MMRCGSAPIRCMNAPDRVPPTLTHKSRASWFTSRDTPRDAGGSMQQSPDRSARVASSLLSVRLPLSTASHTQCSMDRRAWLPLCSMAEPDAAMYTPLAPASASGV